MLRQTGLQHAGAETTEPGTSVIDHKEDGMDRHMFVKADFDLSHGRICRVHLAGRVQDKGDQRTAKQKVLDHHKIVDHYHCGGAAKHTKPNMV